MEESDSKALFTAKLDKLVQRIPDKKLKEKLEELLRERSDMGESEENRQIVELMKGKLTTTCKMRNIGFHYQFWKTPLDIMFKDCIFAGTVGADVSTGKKSVEIATAGEVIKCKLKNGKYFTPKNAEDDHPLLPENNGNPGDHYPVKLGVRFLHGQSVCGSLVKWVCYTIAILCLLFICYDLVRLFAFPGEVQKDDAPKDEKEGEAFRLSISSVPADVVQKDGEEEHFRVSISTVVSADDLESDGSPNLPIRDSLDVSRSSDAGSFSGSDGGFEV